MATIMNNDDNFTKTESVKMECFDDNSMDDVSPSNKRLKLSTDIDIVNGKTSPDQKSINENDYIDNNWKYNDKNENSMSMNPDFPSGKLTLWQFLLELLMSEEYSNLIKWTDRSIGEFILIQAEEVAKLWGIRKDRNHRMNYDKLSRALRYYYQKNIIKKVHGHKFVYRFVNLVPDILQSPQSTCSTSTILHTGITSSSGSQNLISSPSYRLVPKMDANTVTTTPSPENNPTSTYPPTSPSSSSASTNNNITASASNKDLSTTLNAFFQAALLSLANNNSTNPSNTLYEETLKKQHNSNKIDSTTNNNLDCICGGNKNNRNSTTTATTTKSSNCTSISSSSSSSSTTTTSSSINNAGLISVAESLNNFMDNYHNNHNKNNNDTHFVSPTLDRQSLLHFSLNSINMQRLSQEILLHSSGTNKSRLCLSSQSHHVPPQSSLQTLPNILSSNKLTPPPSTKTVPHAPPTQLQLPKNSPEQQQQQQPWFSKLAQNFWQSLSTASYQQQQHNQELSEKNEEPPPEEDEIDEEIENEEEQITPTDLTINNNNNNNNNSLMTSFMSFMNELHKHNTLTTQRQHYTSTTQNNHTNNNNNISKYYHKENNHKTNRKITTNTTTQYTQRDFAHLLKSQLESKPQFVWMPIPANIAEQFLQNMSANNY